MNENENVEFKESFDDRVIESLTAFANTKGGRVLIGVNDKGEPVKNLKIGKESIQKSLNEIKTKTEPSIIPDVEIISYKGVAVIEFSVKEFPIKPIACRGRYYKRVNNSNHRLSASEISDVYLLAMQYSWDSYLYNGATQKDLNIYLVKKFVEKVNKSRRFSLPAEPVEALKKLNMIKNGYPTNAAMILFSKQDLRYNVHIGRFKTPSMIIDDKMISGDLFSVVAKAMKVIIGHLKFAFFISGRKIARDEIPEYPLDAIREILLNTLIHRDYQSPTDVQIKIFDNEIKFFNPSGLFGNITEEKLKTNGYSASTRNKQLAEAFYLTHDIEKYGSGFIRVRKAIETYPTMKFNFSVIDNGCVSEFKYSEQKIELLKNEEIFDISIFGDDLWLDNVNPENDTVNPENDNVNPENDTVNPENDNVNDTVNLTVKILSILKKEPDITQLAISEALSVSKTTIVREIKKLQENNVIKRVGSDKSGYWEIL
ncbi:MAG: putative DNA binding domain-containing protein [Fibromonadales bacterium]|nr:putative DNA binding domain-containing protein [Fibromonadales bacterium]